MEMMSEIPTESNASETKSCNQQLYRSNKRTFCNRSSEHTHETGRVCLVRADLAINLDVALHQDGLHLTVGKSIFQPVPEYQDQREALPGLVRTR
jgi:hypothetical protein